MNRSEKLKQTNKHYDLGIWIKWDLYKIPLKFQALEFSITLFERKQLRQIYSDWWQKLISTWIIPKIETTLSKGFIKYLKLLGWEILKWNMQANLDIIFNRLFPLVFLFCGQNISIANMDQVFPRTSAGGNIRQFSLNQKIRMIANRI